MRIGGYGQYDLYNGFNASEAINKIPRVSVDEITQKENDVAAASTGNIAEKPSAERIEVKNASLDSISEGMKSVTAFEMKGRESNIDDLDIKQAVSDLRKDETLQQYQYFVGDVNALINTEDGIVIQKS